MLATRLCPGEHRSPATLRASGPRASDAPCGQNNKSLQLSVVMGLRKGLSRIRGMRRSLTEEDQRKIAEEIIKELETSNWKITQGPPPEGGAAHIAGPPQN